MPRRTSSAAPTIALIGRTNVGKSTLFNRLIDQRVALVSPESGTTRDRNIGTCYWRGRMLTIVDTGGLDLGGRGRTTLPRARKLHRLKKNEPNPIEPLIVRQALAGIAQADFLVVVVDGKVGIQHDDRTVVTLARKSGKPFIVVVNKIDRAATTADRYDFAALSPDLYALSAATGRGVGDFLDVLLKHLNPPASHEESEQLIRVAIIGKPNVGKSSLLNAILGEERVIVSPVPHTTRESQRVRWQFGNQLFELTDTAGIRRRSRGGDALERAGVKSSHTALAEADIALLVVDAAAGLTTQDAQLAGDIVDAKCGLIIVGNKWDAIHGKTTTTPNEFTAAFRRTFPAFPWAPILFTSAKTGQRVPALLERCQAVYAERHKQLSDSVLERLLKAAARAVRPAKAKGNIHPFIYSLRQIAVAPPRFELLIHPKAEVHTSYLRFLENQIRRQYGFDGTPIIVSQRFYKK